MANRNWSLQFKANELFQPGTSFASDSVDATTFIPLKDFDWTSDESLYLEYIVPEEHVRVADGGNVPKMKIKYRAATTSTTLDARIDVSSEARTPNNNEPTDADSFSGPDSATLLFSSTSNALREIEITLSAMTTEDATKGDKVRHKITRDADHATLDDLAVDLQIDMIEIWQDE